jgi:hypothetical protein
MCRRLSRTLSSWRVIPLTHGSIPAHRPGFTQRWERGSFTISKIEGIVQSIHRAKQSLGTLLIPTHSFSLRVVGASHPRFHSGQIHNSTLRVAVPSNLLNPCSITLFDTENLQYPQQPSPMQQPASLPSCQKAWERMVSLAIKKSFTRIR